ncbi:hypothetical protein ACFLTE_05115 [Bacteroidota bacterium]
MKKLNMNYKKLLPACAFVFAGFMLQAQEYSDNIKLSKSFKVNTSSTVEVYNKYGKLHIVTWEHDSVKFDVHALIQSSTETKVRKLRDNISFDFTGTEYYITAKSVFSNKYSGFFKDLADFAEGLITSDNKVEIDYKIYIPEYVNLKLNNKFGDIYIENIIGDINITLSNGALKANNFEGNSIIKLTMGDADIKMVKNGKIYTNYSELNIDECDQINIDSKLSKINIDVAKIIKVSSKKDKIYINSMDQIYGESYFTDIWVYDLANKMSYKANYGNINLESIKKGFSFIDITTEYTDINMFFEEESVFDVDIVDKGSFLQYPINKANVKRESIDNDEERFNTFGVIGTGTSESKLKIEATKGNIHIYYK